MFVIPKQHKKKIDIETKKKQFLAATETMIENDINHLRDELNDCRTIVQILKNECAVWQKGKKSGYSEFPKYFKGRISADRVLSTYFNDKEPIENKKINQITKKFWNDCVTKSGGVKESDIAQKRKELIIRKNFYHKGIVLLESLLKNGKLNYKKIQGLPCLEMEEYYEKNFYHNADINILKAAGKNFFEQDGILQPDKLKKGSLERELCTEAATWLDRCFSYRKFSSKGHKPYGAYDLCRDLGIRVCIYCNINYIYTIDDSQTLETEEESSKKSVGSGEVQLIARPELDHYLPKSKFPMFQMSFENLIPSCSICNGKIKRDSWIKTKEHLHPYQEEETKMNFYLDSGNQIKIRYPGTKDEQRKNRNTSKFFKTMEVYGFFQNQIEDILEKKDVYTPDYLAELESMIPKEKRRADKKRLMKDILGYVKSDDIMNTSLGKLRRDLITVILDEYK